MKNIHKKYDLFGKTLIEFLAFKPPFNLEIPKAYNACFYDMIQSDLQYTVDEKVVSLAKNESTLLNCKISSKNY